MKKNLGATWATPNKNLLRGNFFKKNKNLRLYLIIAKSSIYKLNFKKPKAMVSFDNHLNLKFLVLKIDELININFTYKFQYFFFIHFLSIFK